MTKDAAVFVACTDCGRGNLFVRQWFQHDDETVCPPCELIRQGIPLAAPAATCLNDEPCCPCQGGCCGCAS